jgi:hypothetical protein
MPKPYAKLNRNDLLQSAVWEWMPDDESATHDNGFDESFVQPTGLVAIPQTPFSQFVVATTVGLKDGSSLPGIAEVTVADGKVSVQPTTVLLLDRHLQIPGVETNRLLTRFTKTVENYPISWRLNVPIEGEVKVRAGRIKGGNMKSVVAVGMAILRSLKALRK